MFYHVVGEILPRHNGIDNCLLFAGGTAQIDTGGFDTFMSHKVGKQGDIVAVFKKIFGVPMPKGVRVDNMLVQTIFPGKCFQLI